MEMVSWKKRRKKWLMKVVVELLKHLVVKEKTKGVTKVFENRKTIGCWKWLPRYEMDVEK